MYYCKLGGVFVKFVYEDSYKIIKLDVDVSNTIKDIKSKIQEKELIPIHSQLLKFNEKLLEDDHFLLSYYDIQNESTLDLEG